MEFWYLKFISGFIVDKPADFHVVNVVNLKFAAADIAKFQTFANNFRFDSCRIKNLLSPREFASNFIACGVKSKHNKDHQQNPKHPTSECAFKP